MGNRNATLITKNPTWQAESQRLSAWYMIGIEIKPQFLFYSQFCLGSKWKTCVSTDMNSSSPQEEMLVARSNRIAQKKLCRSICFWECLG
jgi:hypothetical protein